MWPGISSIFVWDSSTHCETMDGLSWFALRLIPSAKRAWPIAALGSCRSRSTRRAFLRSPIFEPFLAYRRVMRLVRPTAYLGWTIKPNIYGGLAARSHGNTCHLEYFGPRNCIHSGHSADEDRNGPVSDRACQGRDGVFSERDRPRPVRGAIDGQGISRPDFCPVRASTFIQYAPAPAMLREKGHFLMIARLLGDKGVREFVAAARILKARGCDAHFSLLGFLDVANRTAITRDEVAAWVAEGIIAYHPPVDDVRDMIASADAVVLPSYREGTSRVLLEACALARPVIASDVPGCREIVEDGCQRLLVRTARSALARRRDGKAPRSR